MRLFLTTSLIVMFMVLTGCHHRSKAAKHPPRKFVEIERLENGGAAYHDGTNWWYYHINIDSDEATYSTVENTWVPSTRSPADFRLSMDAKNSAIEEVEVTADGKPEGEILSQGAASELESQVNDMISEGNPNNQDASGDSDAESSASDSGSSDSGGGDSGGGDSGGGDGGGD